MLIVYFLIMRIFVLELSEVTQIADIYIVTLSPNHYQELSTSLLSSVIQADKQKFLILFKDKK